MEAPESLEERGARAVAIGGGHLQAGPVCGLGERGEVEVGACYDEETVPMEAEVAQSIVLRASREGDLRPDFSLRISGEEVELG